MPFVKEFYDPETLQLMTRALKEALRESTRQFPANDQTATRAKRKS